MFEHREPKPRPVFKSLRDEVAIRQQYSTMLDEELPSFESRDEITVDVMSTICKRINIQLEKPYQKYKPFQKNKHPTSTKQEEPWATVEFREHVEKVATERDKKVRKKMAKKLRKVRTKLKTEFYKRRAAKINTVAENRLVEEEYRLLREEKMLKKEFKISVST